MAASGRNTGRIEASRLYASTARWMQRMAALRPQTEALVHLLVEQLLGRDLVRHLACEQLPDDPVGGGVKPSHDCLQPVRLGGIGEDLYLQGDLHAVDFRRLKRGGVLRSLKMPDSTGLQ